MKHVLLSLLLQSNWNIYWFIKSKTVSVFSCGHVPKIMWSKIYMCLKECCFMVVVACTLGSRLWQAIGFCLRFYLWEFLMKHCGHGHDVHSFSSHTVITSHFSCFISHIYRVSQHYVNSNGLWFLQFKC
jgi:hypothetical protein